ncbi:putative serine esterase-domain-containing protein [Amanita rubescens]|nr:putative serine esterase-domain-containing protein [Amanita rubescens]
MSSVHLLALVHGMWGNPGHLAELSRVILDTYPAPVDDMELQVLVAETNRDDSTYDGIDWGAERVAQEIFKKVEELEGIGKQVKRLSITGYSLGGLIGRYLVGILFQRGFFEKVEPVNFNTFATPHLGLPRYPSLLSRVFSQLGPKLLSRTGEQFYCVDRWSPKGRPLLDIMADPDHIFYQGLLSFKHIRIYANAVNDLTVPYITAAIELEDPFLDYEKNKMTIQFDPKYEPLMTSYAPPSSPPVEPAVLSREWMMQWRPRKIMLPPILQREFPLNMLIYLCIPLLVPVALAAVAINLSLASRSSRARLRLLEQDESHGERLVHVLAKLEGKSENDAVLMLKEDSTDVVAPTDISLSVLTPLQRKIALSLNRLPLKKESVFITGVINSHAVIVCRDVRRYEIHRRGEGVIKHWAASFVL